MTLTIFGVPISLDDFIGLLVALGLAIYLIYCLIKPGRL